MAIGTPVSLGATAPSPTSTSLTLPLIASANTGQTICVFIMLGSSRTPTFADDAGHIGNFSPSGNTYNAGTSAVFPGIGIMWFAQCVNPTVPMTAANSIQVSWTGGADDPTLSAFQVSGLDLTSPLDVTGTPVSGTGQTVSGLTVTPSGNELLVAATVVNGLIVGGSYAADTTHSWANVNNIQEGAGGAFMAVDAQTASAAKACAPTWTNSLVYASMGWTLKAGSSPPPGVSNGLLTLGVG